MDLRDPEAKPLRADWRLLSFPAFVLAAAIAVWWWAASPGRLSPYALELEGLPRQSERGPIDDNTAPALLELGPGRDLTLVLRPHSVPSEPIEVRTFVAAEGAADREAIAVAVDVRALTAGALQLTLSAATLPTRGRLVVLIGRRGNVPGSASTGTAGHGHGWQRFDVRFSRSLRLE